MGKKGTDTTASSAGANVAAPALEARGLTLAWDGVHDVVRGIDLHVMAGETVCIVGKSGCGKTTILHALSGLTRPREGVVLLHGEDLGGRPGLVSYMLQKDLLLPSRTILDNAVLPLVVAGQKKAAAREQALPLFERFGLSGCENKWPGELSGGMRQRAAFLRTYLMGNDVALLDENDKPVATGEVGEICINVKNGAPCGLFIGYYRDEEKTKESMHDGYYHTGDTAWRDEDGYFWYVGRKDDVIKSSGYRIGPFEIENVIMELPYVLECGVSAAPDELRGQVVKASIVLTKGTAGTEELKKEIQNYVKSKTAPYKYPRIVVFKDELPKTTSGKIQRNKL